MSNYYTLKTAINANIKQNGNQEITGPILNSVLNQMVNILGTGYQFAGVATLDPATEPGTPDAKVFYIANGKGIYTNFGSLEVTEDEVVIFYWDSAWHKVATGIAREEKLTDLEKEVATKQDIIPDLDTIRAGAALGASALHEETDPSVPSWAKEATKPSYTPAEVGAASEEALQSHVSDNIRHITAAERAEWSAKQDALTLTIKDNGNIVLANIQGQSKEFMPATPSGDPMHYAYEAVGAVWNSTGSDIVKTAPWAELADDDADKVVIHKAGHWYLNGLGDLTNDDMRLVYFSLPFNGSYIQGRYYNESTRTIVCTKSNASSFISIPMKVMFRNSKIEVFGNDLSNTLNVNDDMFFAFAFSNIKAILYTISLSSVKVSIEFSPFQTVYSLKYVKLKGLNNSISMITCSLLSSRSILYMIQNENATSAITITLHADAYARAMENADILAALEAHPNVSLASA